MTATRRAAVLPLAVRRTKPEAPCFESVSARSDSRYGASAHFRPRSCATPALRRRDAALADLIANAQEGFAYQIAEVYALRGEKDKAFDWLEIGLHDRDAGMLGLLVDPLLRGLRDDPRYGNLLAKVGLPTTP